MYEEDLTNLEDWLRRLKVEYDIFLNGHRKKPPDDLRMKVERHVKRLSECPDMSFAERFRYNTLVGRFYVYRDLWRRTLMEREATAPEKGAAASEAPVLESAQFPLPAEEIRVAITDPESEEEKVRQLYQSLLNMRGRHIRAPASITYAQFLNYIATQTRTIRGRWGCKSVIFTLAIEDNAVKFTARAGGNT